MIIRTSYGNRRKVNSGDTEIEGGFEPEKTEAIFCLHLVTALLPNAGAMAVLTRDKVCCVDLYIVVIVYRS